MTEAQSAEIAELRTLADDAERLAREARARYHAAVVAAAEFHVGDIVAVKNGVLMKITSVNWAWGTSVSYRGVKKKRDGTWGAQVAGIWGSIELAPEQTIA